MNRRMVDLEKGGVCSLILRTKLWGFLTYFRVVDFFVVFMFAVSKLKTELVLTFETGLLEVITGVDGGMLLVKGVIASSSALTTYNIC